jgi:hypothetical protein
MFKEFKTDRLTKFFILALLIGFFITAVISTFHKINLHPEKIIGGYLIIILFILSALNQFFFVKSLNFTIRIDEVGIYINEILYKWKDIYVTAIMEKGSGRRSDYLLIALNDMKTYTIFNLVNFHGFKGFSFSLSNYIEYFKSLSGIKQDSVQGFQESIEKN